ncbi:MAG: hypothetical protein H0W69_08505 [Gemmatimonadaceae bacterium]|nr:hypothetical protein [Gemmatimonadaceae bacterium]
MTTPFIAVAQTGGAPQVGYPTSRSPFTDLEYRQELTVFGGQFKAGTEPAAVAPRSGPMVGARYEITVGGPAQLYVRGSRVFSERRALDPTKPVASRFLGVSKTPLYLADLGVSVNLTGQRSFHGIVPSLAVGAGVASTLNSKVEKDPYKFGTTFAFSFGGGLRILPTERIQIRVDGGTHMYQIRYPTEYSTSASDNTTVIPSGQAKSFWKSNPSITAGLSYLFFR